MTYRKNVCHLIYTVILCCMVILVAACSQSTLTSGTPTAESPAPAASATDTPPSPTPSPSPSITVAPSTEVSVSATAQAATPTATQSPLPSASSTAFPTTAAGNAQGAIIVDHASLEQFDDIPDEYVDAATQIRLLVRHASVGWNIDNALNCLMDDSGNQPYHCDRGLDDDQIVHDARYDRSKWNFEFHATPNANPGWYNKVAYFIERVDEVQANQNYDGMLMLLAYLDGAPGSSLDDQFFDQEQNDQVGIAELEAVQERHPNTKMIWTTLALSRDIGGADSASFNQQLRDYVRANGGFLLDFADIGSHAPDGTLCLDDAGEGNPVLCPQYTDEIHGGHLNSPGAQRAARALWIIVARLAGWQGTP